jgi:hypothetical protein
LNESFLSFLFVVLIIRCMNNRKCFTHVYIWFYGEPLLSLTNYRSTLLILKSDFRSETFRRNALLLLITSSKPFDGHESDVQSFGNLTPLILLKHFITFSLIGLQLLLKSRCDLFCNNVSSKMRDNFFGYESSHNIR